MTGVIVMAGGKSRRNLVEVVRDAVAYPFMKIAEVIGGYPLEVPIRGYKPIRKVKEEIDDIVKKRPMITYIIDKLAKTKNIEQIVVVGEENILSKCLKENLPSDSYTKFRDIGKVVQQAGDFRANGYKGYANLFQNVINSSKGYALFMFADAINCTSSGIEKFIEESKEKVRIEDVDVILGVATKNQLKGYKKYFPRPPLELVDDINFSEEDRDENGLVGLRSADRIYANLQKIKNPWLIDEAYKYRRLAKMIVHPKKSNELKRRLGISLAKYLQKKLTISEILTKASEELGAKVTLLKVGDAECSLDLDAERDISASEKMNHELNHRKK
jgi:hypothetical protein